MFRIRRANENDFRAICDFDEVAKIHAARIEFIRKSLAEAVCLIAEAPEKIVGYGVLTNHFFGYCFVDLIYVDAGFRQRGIGEMLLVELENSCQTEKIFTSTNLSNLPAQKLFNKIGYTLSGVVHNLDENDPEIIFYKLLSK
jgi:ribosomal protein S18 acetylase RimI-like enzyme